MLSMRRIFFSITLILLLVSSNYIQAFATTNVIRVVTEHLPPYQIGKDKILVGGNVGLPVKSLLKTVAPTAQIEVMPWARAFKIASSRPNTIIFSLVRTPEREDNFIWIGKVAHVKTRLYTLAGSEINPVDNLNELRPFQIGVKRQDAIATYLTQEGFKYGENLIEIVNTVSTVQMLERNRIPIIPGNSQIIEYYCEQTGCDKDNFKIIYTVKDLSEEFYLAVSLGTDPALIKQLRAEFPNVYMPLIE